MNSPERASFFTYVNLQFDSNCRDFKISCLQVDCKMLFCQNCDDMASQAPQMLQHLNEQGTPIMMGSLAVLAVFFFFCVPAFPKTLGEVRGCAWHGQKLHLICKFYISFFGQSSISPCLQQGSTLRMLMEKHFGDAFRFLIISCLFLL